MSVPPLDEPVPRQYEENDCDDYARDKSGDSTTGEAEAGARRPSQCPSQEEAPEKNTEEGDAPEQWGEYPQGRHDIVGLSPYADGLSDGVLPKLGRHGRCQMR